jgi:hypothetical protein
MRQTIETILSSIAFQFERIPDQAGDAPRDRRDTRRIPVPKV